MAKKESKENLMEKIVSLSKRRGFVYQGSEIYGGLAGTWDYGPYGAELAHNIKDLWWKHFVHEQENIFGISTPTIMPESVWKASGHLAGFTDPFVECKKCHHRFRADQLENAKKCPDCGGELGLESKFNLMFPISVGSGGSDTAYLRGEIAQGMFVNFKNILDTMHPDLPFGLAQIGKAYRNEIAPRDFLFRAREFDLMEFEYFVREKDWEKYFEIWRTIMASFAVELGVQAHEFEVPAEDRAHYSKRTIDFQFDYPFGRGELWGLAYRTDFDLKNHGLDYFDDESGERFAPHVIEPSLGVDRTALAVLLSAYTEDELGGEKRVYLKLPKNIAPVRAAVFPLLKNKPELVSKARELFLNLKLQISNLEFDDNGNIGKRYRRQDEIGTPQTITVDFQTLEDDTVTVRDRDTGEQERVSISDLVSKIKG